MKDFDELLDLIARQPKGPFKPDWWYNRHGDLIEIYFTNESHIARWVNPRLTILEADDGSGRIVGAIIEGIWKDIKEESSRADAS